ncbi:DUF2178 domain-containing protein [Methanospirillum lacunae]|uniref:DUF2178 domain-containing protein n=1 Tax=Methanospirillum lacunae TaxID=668570 RepID=A0A2V2N1U4_9EURY|nr:DUF2178 domain-containing protein [Methanospirillum lacunae]PWR71686.1 hypothetical protein DK846_12640 [Methanospirillum lacunae]
MKYQVFLIISAAVACLVASLIGWSMATGYLIIPVIAIPLGVIIVFACRQHVDIVLGDDRVREIRSLAALRTLEIFVILGAIGAVILYSFLISDPLSPTINGRYHPNGDGTRSMEITMYEPGFPGNHEHVIRSTTIPNIDAMNETEAIQYCGFRRESFLDNERKGLVGITLACGIISLLALFGVFNLYYSRKF